MSAIKRWMTGLIVVGSNLMLVCQIASAQSVFDDSDAEAAPPKAEWRQKVLHNNRGQQQITRTSAQESEPRTIQWSPYPNARQEAESDAEVHQRLPYTSSQKGEYRVAQRTSNVNASQDMEGRAEQRLPHQDSSRMRPAGSYSPGGSPNRNYRVAQREMPVSMEGDSGPSTTQFEPLAPGGAFGPQGGCDSCGGNCGSCGSDCGDCGCGDCGDCGDCDCPWLAPCGGWGPRNLAIFAGINGFKGPRDRGGNGNFGFTEGVNWGAPLGDPWGCGYQLGFAALQDNLSGYQLGTPVDGTNQSSIVTADRHQYFFTAGVFNRAECGGWQWGVAFDLLHDTYYESSDLKQIRTETGYLINECSEIGYSGAYGVGGDKVQTYYSLNGRTSVVNAFLNPTDQFVVYFRRHFQNGGEGRIWGGLTGYSDGLFGADSWVPLGGSWALQNTFNYLIPKQGKGEAGGQVNESWSLAINLVWYPGRSTKCLGTSCYRPVLNVADNSLFMVRENREITR
jgi:hypothetical protein